MKNKSALAARPMEAIGRKQPSFKAIWHGDYPICAAVVASPVSIPLAFVCRKQIFQMTLIRVFLNNKCAKSANTRILGRELYSSRAGNNGNR